MSSSINPQNNRDLNQGILNIWSKFGGPSLNGWWIIGRTSSNGVNFDFEGKFDLEGKGQSPPKTIRTLTKVFYIYGSNLVTPAWTGLELSRGQASDWHTDGQTDAGNDNTRWPYRPRVKTGIWQCSRHLFWGILIAEMFPSAILCFYIYFSSC